MTPDRAEKLHALFRAAVHQAPEERTAYLDAACTDDPALRREVDALLAADDQAAASSFLETPAVDAFAPRLAAGQQIGTYTLLERIGQGGMGIVFKAHDHRLERFVALKFLPPYLAAVAHAQTRFLQEARAASALDHPNICTIYEIEETDEGLLYIAMACYDGETLAQKIARGPLPIDASLDYAEQAAMGLRRAHEAGIVHRDVKPSNLIVTPREEVKILDFGIAKLEGRADVTHPGTRVGTAAYMSPEQARGEAVDHRTDVWAPGVVLYEMLTGERPFAGEGEQATLHRILHHDPPPLTTLRPEVPTALAHVVERAVAKDPSDRYPDAATLHADLTALQSDAPTLPRRRLARPRRWHRVLGLTAGVALLLVVAFVLTGRRFFASPPAPGPIRSLAVLPLANFSGDPEQEFFADGMTEALITELGQIEALRVISRTSAMQYKDAQQSVPEIARALGVDAVVEGSVLPAGQRIGISVKLIDGRTDELLWTSSYEGPLRDVLTLQHEVALTIAREIQATLTPQEEARLIGTAPVDPEAYRLYLYGQHFRNQETPEHWKEAVGYFEQAIAHDSTFAPAYAGLSRVLTHTLPASEADRAHQAAERALDLDPSLADAYVSIGLFREMLDWDWQGAEEAFRRAVYLNPSNGEAHHELGLLLMRMRRFDEALFEAQRALALDPLSVRYQNGVAAVHLFSGQYEQATPLLQQSLQLEPSNPMTYWRLGQVYQETGRLDDAIDAFETMAERGGYQPIGHLGHAYAAAGRRADALAEIDRLKAQYEQATDADAGWIPWNIALIYTGLGDPERALDWLERAYAERTNLLMYLGIVPAFAPLHETPRFQALLDRVGLLPPANAS